MPGPVPGGRRCAILLAIVILAALAWSGFWWFNASARERALDRWLAERRADGWQAEAADLRVTGFPNRVDVLVTDLRLADPEAGWSWHASGVPESCRSPGSRTSSSSPCPGSRWSRPPTRR